MGNQGSLRSLINAQKQKQHAIINEASAMRRANNMMRQSVFGLKELQAINGKGARHHRFIPETLLADAIEDTIIYKLSDFGKSKGSAAYTSSLHHTMEGADINSLAVMGLEVLSVFGCHDNYLWEAVWEGCPLKVRENVVPHIRDDQIRLIMQQNEQLFASDAVNDFFRQLGHFATSHNATMAEFELFLDIEAK